MNSREAKALLERAAEHASDFSVSEQIVSAAFPEPDRMVEALVIASIRDWRAQPAPSAEATLVKWCVSQRLSYRFDYERHHFIFRRSLQ